MDICLIILLSIIFGKIETCASKDSLKALPNSLIFISLNEKDDNLLIQFEMSVVSSSYNL